jgi:hypothetical protein
MRRALACHAGCWSAQSGRQVATPVLRIRRDPLRRGEAHHARPLAAPRNARRASLSDRQGSCRGEEGGVPLVVVTGHWSLARRCSACPGPVPDLLTSGPMRVFCCRDRQPQLRRRLLDRDRLPLPTILDGLDGHYPAVRYYAVLRLLLGHQPSLPPAYRTPEPNRSPRVSR